jgi:hypothetical protein
MVHGSLEEGWCVGQSEVHNMWDISSKLCFDGGLVLIFLHNSNVVVFHAYVKL